MGSTVVPSALTRWFEAFRQDVLEGRVSLEELLIVADADMQSESVDLCPRCTKRPVRSKGKQYAPYRSGICSVCHLQRLASAHRDALAELEATREYNAVKAQLKRRRKELGVPAPRRAGKDKSPEDYGRYWCPGTDEPHPFAHCDTCSEAFRDHGEGHTACPECRARAEARGRSRRTMTEQLEGRFSLHAQQAIDDAKAIYERDPDALWAGEFVIAAVDALSRLHGLVDDDE